MKFASFDLEIAKVLPPEITDLKAHAPLGIACAAVALSDRPDVLYWQGTPQLSAAEALLSIEPDSQAAAATIEELKKSDSEEVREDTARVLKRLKKP